MSEPGVEELREAIAIEDLYVNDEATGEDYTHAYFAYEEKYGEPHSDTILEAARLQLARIEGAPGLEELKKEISDSITSKAIGNGLDIVTRGYTDTIVDYLASRGLLTVKAGEGK